MKVDRVAIILPVGAMHASELKEAVAALDCRDPELDADVTLLVVCDGFIGPELTVGRGFDVLLSSTGMAPQGAPRARNLGIETALAMGADFVAFLDVDDRWTAGHLSGCLELLRREGVDLAYGRLFGPAWTWRTQPPAAPLSALAFDSYISAQTIVARADLVRKVRFDESLPRLQDWDYALRAFQSGVTLGFNAAGGAVINDALPGISRGSGASGRYLDALETVLTNHVAVFRDEPRALFIHVKAYLVTCAKTRRAPRRALWMLIELARSVVTRPGRLLIDNRPYIRG